MNSKIYLCLERRFKKGKDEWKQCNISGFFSTWGYSNDNDSVFNELRDISNYWTNRGIPTDLDFSILEKYVFRIHSDEIYNLYYSNNGERVVSESICNYWVDNCDCKIISTKYGKFVTCPYYKSTSWCTTKELETCLQKVKKHHNKESSIEFIHKWISLIIIMEMLEHNDEYECRAVFWFEEQM